MNTVPMDSGGLERVQVVFDVHNNRVAHAHLDRRPGQHAVHGLDGALYTVGRHTVRSKAVRLVERTIEAITREY